MPALDFAPPGATLELKMQLLRALKLWRPPRNEVREGASYAELCNCGALVGGLSIALDLRPDELVGPLTALLGGSAAKLRLLDVRDRPVPTLTAFFAGKAVTWEVPSCEALVQELNGAFADDSTVKAAALLGEWDDLRQLWCVPKGTLPVLLEDPRFRPENGAQLEAMRSRLEGGDDSVG